MRHSAAPELRCTNASAAHYDVWRVVTLMAGDRVSATFDMATSDGYARQMRTIVRLDDRILQRAAHEAERRGVSLASLVEQGLQLVLRQRTVDRSGCRTGTVVPPGVDMNSGARVFDQTTHGD
jgi:hypothetical protein